MRCRRPIWITVAVLALVAGCPPRLARAAEAPARIQIVAPARLSPQFAWALLIKERLGKEEGLEAEVVGAAGAMEALKHAVVGRADFAATAPTTHIIARAEGIPSLAVFSHRQSYIYEVVALQDRALVRKLLDLVTADAFALPKGRPLGWVDGVALAREMNFLLGIDVIKRTFDPKETYTNRFVEAANRELPAP